MIRKKRVAYITNADLGDRKNRLSGLSELAIETIKPDLVLCRNHKNPLYKGAVYKNILPGGNIFGRFMTMLSQLTGDNITYHQWYSRVVNFVLLRNHKDYDVYFFDHIGSSEVIQRVPDATTMIFGSSPGSPVLQKLLETEGVLYNQNNISHNLETTRGMYRSVDYIFSFSPFVDQDCRSMGIPEKNIIPSYLGIDTKKYKKTQKRAPHADQDKFVVLSVSDFNVFKGLRYAIQAFVEADIPGSIFYVVGNVDTALKKEIAEYRDSRIILTGFADPRPYYEQADVFVLASLSEGSARVIMEAAMYELPVITTPNAGGVIEDDVSGKIVSLREYQPISKALITYFQDIDLRNNHGQNARKTVEEKYNFDTFKTNLEKQFSLIVK